MVVALQRSSWEQVLVGTTRDHRVKVTWLSILAHQVKMNVDLASSLANVCNLQNEDIRQKR